MNRIDQVFANGRKAFIPYITAGFPSIDDTLKIMRLLVANGADIIELGFPFSDPTADGPVIQASSQAALEAGFHRADYMNIIRRFRETDTTTPVVVFSYYNPVFSNGAEAFARDAAAAGADAFLVVDLPLEEQGEFRPALDELGLYLIQLVAPTTPPERCRRIVAAGGGFIYQIARKGVTGVRDDLGTDITAPVRATKAFTDLPVALGFGVKNGAQARTVAAVADGVIVGSALVQCLEAHGAGYAEPFAALARDLADGTHS